MAERDRWQERIKEIHGVNMPWCMKNQLVFIICIYPLKHFNTVCNYNMKGMKLLEELIIILHANIYLLSILCVYILHHWVNGSFWGKYWLSTSIQTGKVQRPLKVICKKWLDYQYMSY